MQELSIIAAYNAADTAAAAAYAMQLSYGRTTAEAQQVSSGVFAGKLRDLLR